MRTRSRLIVIPALVAVAGLVCGGVGWASTPASPATRHLSLASFSVQEIHARDACEADGATVATAMAAFNAENPGTAVTAAALVDKRNGGPYLQNWPYNPAYYRYSIKAGILRLNLLKSVGPPFVYSKSTVYKGPRSCKDVRALRGTQLVLNAVAACQADGATVATAIAALDAQYPGTRPTARGLVSSAHGGPYIESWPYNPAYYRYSIKVGILKLSIVTSSGPPATFSAPTTYEGPQDCSFG
jgi:hypothetical protein